MTWFPRLLALAFLVTVSTAFAADIEQEYRDGNEQQRASLMNQIGRAETASAEELEVLLSGLGDTSNLVQYRAALALATKGIEQPKAAEALITSLDDDSPEVRAASAHALSLIAPESVPAATALAKHVTDDQALVRRASILALRRMKVDRAMVRPILLSALRSGDSAVVASALHEIASLGDQVIAELKEALTHEEGRYWAALVIQEMGPEAHETVMPLREVLSSEKAEDRLQAILALAAIGDQARSAADQLAEILKNDSFEGPRFAAAYALGRIGAQGVADQQLIAAAKSDSPLLRLMGAWSLAKLYPANEEYTRHATEVIFSSMKSDDSTLRQLAARALVESDLPYEQTAPLAEEALATSTPQTIEHVVEAIAAQGKAALPRVTTALTNEKLQRSALRIVQKIGADAAELTPSLVPLLSNDDPQIRREAAFAIAAIGPGAKSAAGDLLAAYRDETERENRLADIYAAGKIGSAAQGFVPHLKKLSTHPDDQQARVAALWALTRIAPNDEAMLADAIPAMIKSLSEAERSVIKIEMAYALGDLGPKAKSAQAALKSMLSDSDPRVREAARSALEKIGE